MIRISLSQEEHEFLCQFVKTGKKKARAIVRANVLLLADGGYSNDDISKAINVHRQTVWRIKKRFIEEGLDSALEEKPRSGQPKKYTDKQEALIIATACTDPPRGMKRWSIRLLTDEVKKRKDLKMINRESVRLILKKAKLNLG